VAHRVVKTLEEDEAENFGRREWSRFVAFDLGLTLSHARYENKLSNIV